MQTEQKESVVSANNSDQWNGICNIICDQTSMTEVINQLLKAQVGYVSLKTLIGKHRSILPTAIFILFDLGNQRSQYFSPSLPSNPYAHYLLVFLTELSLLGGFSFYKFVGNSVFPGQKCCRPMFPF